MCPGALAADDSDDKNHDNDKNHDGKIGKSWFYRLFGRIYQMSQRTRQTDRRTIFTKLTTIPFQTQSYHHIQKKTSGSGMSVFRRIIPQCLPSLRVLHSHTVSSTPFTWLNLYSRCWEWRYVRHGRKSKRRKNHPLCLISMLISALGQRKRKNNWRKIHIVSKGSKEI